MAKSMGKQKRPSARMKSRSTTKSKLRGTTARSRPKAPAAGSSKGQMSHEKRMT